MNPFIEFAQQFGPVLAILVPIATAIGVAFTIYKAAHDRQIKALVQRNGEMAFENESLKADTEARLRPMIEGLRSQVAKADETESSLREALKATEAGMLSRLADKQNEVDRIRGVSETLTNELEEEREGSAERDREGKSRLNLLKKAMSLQGKVWERKVLQGVPAFRPLGERHVPVISVLNLKGGVGKTTVTANLGAALAAKGYRVLFIDLDLQGSLSSLFMSEYDLTQRSNGGKLLQHFLMGAAERRESNLLEYAVPIFGGSSAIVPNADSMAYAELNLTLQWLLRIGNRDTRFLLRKALHQRRITRRYDIVLLDCPPLFSTCCVNALAVSDYAIIPVVPSKKAAERVPLLLERLQSLHRVINPQLQVMGLLFNRTYGPTLTIKEQDLWRDMLDQCKNQWHSPVPAFDTVIRQTTEVRDNEVEFLMPDPGSDLHSMFSRLAAEVEERLPNDCCRTTDATLGHG